MDLTGYTQHDHRRYVAIAYHCLPKHRQHYAEDIVQTVLLSALQSTTHIDSFPAWISAALRYQGYMHMAEPRTETLDEAVDAPSSELSAEQLMLSRASEQSREEFWLDLAVQIDGRSRVYGVRFREWQARGFTCQTHAQELHVMRVRELIADVLGLERRLAGVKLARKREGGPRVARKQRQQAAAAVAAVVQEQKAMAMGATA